MTAPTPSATIGPGDHAPGRVRCIVEIPKGRRSKFEFDAATGLVRLDRYLYASSHYPGDYGFVPGTLAGDGDPLDVLVMVNEATFPGCLIEARVVGLFRMRDQGRDDFKLLGVPATDPLFDEVRGLSDVPRHFLREGEHFFATYKELEGKPVEVIGWAGRDEAEAEVRDSMKRFSEDRA